MLAVEPVVVGVKREVVEKEEAQPMTLRRRRVTTDRIVLICIENAEKRCKNGVKSTVPERAYHPCLLIR